MRQTAVCLTELPRILCEELRLCPQSQWPLEHWGEDGVAGVAVAQALKGPATLIKNTIAEYTEGW